LGLEASEDQKTQGPSQDETAQRTVTKKWMIAFGEAHFTGILVEISDESLLDSPHPWVMFAV